MPICPADELRRNLADRQVHYERLARVVLRHLPGVITPDRLLASLLLDAYLDGARETHAMIEQQFAPLFKAAGE